jgi:hypothetical protein
MFHLFHHIFSRKHPTVPRSFRHLARCRPQPSARILEVGCCFGQCTVLLASKAMEVLALDTSKDGKIWGKWEENGRGWRGWRLMFSRFSVIFSWHFEVIRDFTCAPKMMVHGMVKPWNGVMWAWDVILCACFHL